MTRWKENDGPEDATIWDVWDHEFHVCISCSGCQRTLRKSPQEVVELLGGDYTLVMVRDRLRCSWCGAKGRNYIDVRPDSLDVAAKLHVDQAQRQLQIYPPPNPYYEKRLAEALANWDARRPKTEETAMCNAYRLKAPLSVLERDLKAVGLPLVFDDGLRPNLPEWEMTRPTNVLPVFKPLDPNQPTKGLQLTNKRWWLVPFFHRKPVSQWKAMCTNARAETVAESRTFKGPFERRRCLVPADGYYEWTGEKGDKTRWLFEFPSSEWFAFAGIWDRAETPDGLIESYSIITTAAGPDAASYHSRQPAILEPHQFAQWLDLSADVSSLIQPSSAGSLKIERA